ncbi:hypothetical protein DRQ21_08750 [Candidatus Fermentibacteria bacterium]|nr:MAG: hypothetical protein DRQ21_08750 [Candidatus Fermentibacteria bacterium]
MTVATLIAVTVVSSALRTPLYDLYMEASSLIAEGNYQESAEIFTEILERMPDNPRAIYNYALSGLVNNDYFTADSLLSIFPEDVFQGDTLLGAKSSARLGNAITGGDYQGVQSVVEMLLPEISTGESSENLRQNYEVALKWLMQNEPPPPEDNQDQSDDNNQDQSDDNQDQQDDNQDQSDDGSPDENQPDDNQDQSDDNQDQSDNNQDQSDDNQDQPDNGGQDEDQSDSDESNQPPPPSDSEMTPEVAQMILDMVEEADADTTGGGTGEALGVPNW